MCVQKQYIINFLMDYNIENVHPVLKESIKVDKLGR